MSLSSEYIVDKVVPQKKVIYLRCGSQTLVSPYEKSDNPKFNYQTDKHLIADLGNGKFHIEDQLFEPENEKIYQECVVESLRLTKAMIECQDSFDHSEQNCSSCLELKTQSNVLDEKIKTLFETKSR